MKTFIEVQNLRCGGCANTITKKLSGLKNITEVEVNIEQSTIGFYHETEEALLLAKNTLKSLGYPTTDTPNSILDKGKSLFSCATGKIS